MAADANGFAYWSSVNSTSSWHSLPLTSKEAASPTRIFKEAIAPGLGTRRARIRAVTQLDESRRTFQDDRQPQGSPLVVQRPGLGNDKGDHVAAQPLA